MKKAAAFAGIALACALWSSACGTSNGDAAEEAPASSSSSSSSSSGSSSGSDRPAFDASFPDEPDANVDPTPEAGADTCIDNDDPGGAENVAKQLPATDDCDNNLKTVKGVMNGAVDVDFYKLSGTDKGGCSLATEFSVASAGVELCVYARCKNATADAVSGCAQGVMSTNAATGMKGCCTNGPGKATPNWDCSGITDDDSADFLIRVKSSGSTDACIAYSFSYVF